MHLNEPRIHLTERLSSEDGTVKFLVRLRDSLSVESVLVPFPKRDAICISTQVGCAMGCRFCHTAKQGLLRHLTPEEIIGQYLEVKRVTQAPGRPSPNIVFMGQGEPLHNFEALKEAIQWLIHPKKGALGPRHITVSTAGYLPGIERFHELGGVNFALSLHSPFDPERSSLIPLNTRWPLETIFKAIDKIPLRRRQFINCEYLVLKNINHTVAHARALKALLGDRPTLVNLIAFNPFPGQPYDRPSDEAVEDFKKLLVAEKLRVFLRTTKGMDILAACGQLNTAEVTA